MTRAGRLRRFIIFGRIFLARVASLRLAVRRPETAVREVQVSAWLKFIAEVAEIGGAQRGKLGPVCVGRNRARDRRVAPLTEPRSRHPFAVAQLRRGKMSWPSSAKARLVCLRWNSHAGFRSFLRAPLLKRIFEEFLRRPQPALKRV